MKRVIDFLVYLTLMLASGAIIQLVKDGGARDQGFNALIEYSGWLNFLPVLWQVSIVLVVGFVVVKTKWRYVRLDRMWGAIIALCFLSALWATYSKIAFNAAIVICLAYILVNLHINILGWQHAILVLHKFFVSTLILSLLAIFLLPSYGISVGDHAGKWQGVFAHKNALGNFASFTFVFYMWWIGVKFTRVKIFAIGLAALLVVGSGSSTALANMLICAALFGLFQFPVIRKLIFKFRYVIVALLAIIVVYTVIMSMSGNDTALMDKDTSFSNRNLIWMYFLQQIENAPWLGQGIGQFGAMLAGDERDFLSSVGFVVGSAHNGFIESWYALGGVGLALILAAIVQTLSMKSDGHAFRLAIYFIFFLVVSNMFESQLLGFNAYFIFLMYVTSITRAMSAEQDQLRFKQGVSKNKLASGRVLQALLPSKAMEKK